MNYLINDAGEVFAFELGVSTPDSLSVVSEAEAMALAAGPEPTLDFMMIEREWRDAVLADTSWLRDRHRDQREIEVATTLSSEQFKELLVYMQGLRDWPQSPDFPNSEGRPVSPDWIDKQIK